MHITYLFVWNCTGTRNSNTYMVHIWRIDDFLLEEIERFSKWDSQYFITSKKEKHFGWVWTLWCGKTYFFIWSSTDMGNNKIDVFWIKRKWKGNRKNFISRVIKPKSWCISSELTLQCVNNELLQMKHYRYQEQHLHDKWQWEHNLKKEIQ